jgi:phosphate transport system protein
VKERDELIDALEHDVEEIVERNLLFQAPVASEFHHLIAALRIVPELERSGDLAEHIATRAARGLGTQLTPAVRGLVEQLGQSAVAIWQAAADAYDAPDPGAADRLESMDDEIDDLHERLWTELAGSDLPNEVVMEMALVARFYERLGDHATHITARLGRLRR